MRIYFTALALIAALLVGCSAPTQSPGMSESPSAGSTANDVVPVPSPTEVPTGITLPADVALESMGDSGVSGTARFNQLTGDQVSISLDIEDNSEFGYDDFGFAALLLSGTCEGRSTEGQRADFEAALDTTSFEAGETGALVISADQLAEIMAAPLSILIADRPGISNLACGEIAVGS